MSNYLFENYPARIKKELFRFIRNLIKFAWTKGLRGLKLKLTKDVDLD